MSSIFGCFTCCAEKDIEAGSPPPEAGWCSFIPTIKGDTTCEKVWNVVKFILVCLAAAALFVYCPYLFVAVFFAGVVFDKWVDEAIDKVTAVVQKYWLPAIILGGIAAFFSLPVTGMILCAFVAGYTGSQASLSTNLHQQEEAAAAAAPQVLPSPAVEV